MNPTRFTSQHWSAGVPSCLLTIATLISFLILFLPAQAQRTEFNFENSEHASPQIEPHAGAWKTWVISSGRDYRVPPPPNRWGTRAELRQLANLTRQHDAATKQQIAYWDAGAPAYRWIDFLNNRVQAGTPTTPFPHRVYAYVALAMYDATIATWEAKYHYNRQRPSDLAPHLRTALPVPNSPSYPSEHAAAAQAAAAVLAYFLPAEAQSFQTMAEQAGWSRVQAGLQYPSDYDAGLALGRRVAEQVIAKARADGSDAVWLGTVPTGPCKWTGTNPGNVTAANWRPLLLHSPDLFRPPPRRPVTRPKCWLRRLPCAPFRAPSPPTTKPISGKARKALISGPSGTSASGPLKIISTKIRHAPHAPTRCSRRPGLMSLLPVRMRSSRTGICDRTSLIRASYRCSQCRTIRVIPRTTRRSPPRGQRSWRIYFRPAPSSFAPWARRRATQESGQAFTTRWTTKWGCSLGGQWRPCSSHARRVMVRSKLQYVVANSFALCRSK